MRGSKLYRQSNFELLRIIAMLMIVIHHFSIHIVFDYSLIDYDINKLWLEFSQPIGKVGVNIFVLISGYFLSQKANVTIEKCLKIWGQAAFYSCAFFVISIIVNVGNFSLFGLISSICPVIYSGWWFIKPYFIMFIISPLLNIILKNITTKVHLIIICIFATFWVLLPLDFQNCLQYSNLMWFIFLYFVASYSRKANWLNRISFIRFIIFAVVSLVFSMLYKFIGIHIPILLDIYSPYAMNSVFVFLCSLFIFLGFKNIKLNNNPLLNTIASATFGVYLIHDHQYIRKILWERLFKVLFYSNSKYFVLYSLFSVICVYCVCTVIDLLRIKFIEKPFMVLYREKIHCIIKKAFPSLFNRLYKHLNSDEYKNC